MYPAAEIAGCSRDEFIADLLREHETEVRRCLEKGAAKVQIDFTEGRLAVKIDPGLTEKPAPQPQYRCRIPVVKCELSRRTPHRLGQLARRTPRPFRRGSGSSKSCLPPHAFERSLMARNVLED